MKYHIRVQRNESLSTILSFIIQMLRNLAEMLAVIAVLGAVIAIPLLWIAANDAWLSDLPRQLSGLVAGAPILLYGSAIYTVLNNADPSNEPTAIPA